MKILVLIFLLIISFPDISLARTIKNHLPDSSSVIWNADEKVEDILNNVFSAIINKQTNLDNAKINATFNSIEDRYSKYKLRQVDSSFNTALLRDSKKLADYYQKIADGYVDSIYKSLYNKILLEDKVAESQTHSGSNLQLFLWLYNNYILKYDLKDSMFVFHIITGTFAKSQTCAKIAKDVGTYNISQLSDKI